MARHVSILLNMILSRQTRISLCFRRNVTLFKPVTVLLIYIVFDHSRDEIQLRYHLFRLEWAVHIQQRIVGTAVDVLTPDSRRMNNIEQR